MSKELNNLYNIDADYDIVADIIADYYSDYYMRNQTFNTKPSCPYYSIGQYIDEDKSVKWNKAEIEKRNAEYKVAEEKLLLEKDKALYNIKEKYADRLSLLLPTLSAKEIIYALDIADDKANVNDGYIDASYIIYMMLIYLANIKTFKEKYNGKED